MSPSSGSTTTTSSSLLLSSGPPQACTTTASAIPPWHTIVVAGLCLLISIGYLIPSLESLDEDLANPSTLLRHSVGFFTNRQIGYIRLLFGSIMVCDSLYTLLWGKWEQDTEYYPGSKLQPQYKLPFRGVLVERPYSLSRGFMTLSSFTMWAWALEGIMFCCLGWITLQVVTSESEGEGSEASSAEVWICRTTAILWEIVAPTSLLVSSIVKYVLWPHALQGEGSSNSNVLKHPGALLEHNFNTMAALLEIGFLGGLPVRVHHGGFAILFGLIYVAFTYAMAYSWPQGRRQVDKKKDPSSANPTTTTTTTTTTPTNIGPQYIYPFFDPTLPGYMTTYCLLGLLAVLLASHLLFCFASLVVQQSPWISVPVIAAAVCRFRD